jgi:hypothetical protein
VAHEKHIGTHSVSFEDPDVYVIIFRGEILGEDIEQIAAIPANVLAPARYRLALVDVSAVTHVDSSARRTGIHKWGEQPRYIQAIVGASFSTRIAIELYVRAVNLIARRERVTNRFFSTQADARAWLREMVEKMRAEKD